MKSRPHVCTVSAAPPASRARIASATGDGLKTLDAVRDSFHAYEVDATIDSFEAAFAEQGVSV